MRIARGVLGALLILIGAIWILQGINVLAGSFMTGQLRWAVRDGFLRTGADRYRAVWSAQ
jgi:hypothetical protein